MHQPEYDSLTVRQAEIAALLVRGKSTREIALKLTLSPRTVETHVAAIYNKYGVSSRAELMLAVLGPSADARASGTLPAADAAKTNLPVRRGALVGRATDIENVIGMSRTNQLVTLTGAGGIGKTQAALVVGEALLEEFRDGVWSTSRAYARARSHRSKATLYAAMFVSVWTTCREFCARWRFKHLAASSKACSTSPALNSSSASEPIMAVA